jgi:hypothetical protein
MSAAADDHQSPVERVLDALRAQGKKITGGPLQYNAQCPAHDDHNPSLGIREGDNGGALVCCQAGCTWQMVAHALNLTAGDLFPPKPTTLARRRKVRSFQYRAADGTVVVTVERWEGEGPKFTRNPAGVRNVPLYNLPEVLAAIRDGRWIIVCEGERDAETAGMLWADLGGVGTTNISGAGHIWTKDEIETLRGAKVVLIGDNDTAGRGRIDTLAIELAGVVKSLHIRYPAEGRKDLTEHVQAKLGRDELRSIEEATGDVLDALEAEDEPEDSYDDDWAPCDLVEIARLMMAGEWQPTVPTVLAVANSLPLFYLERINVLFGESGGGKTWVALLAILEQLRAGHRVLMVDYEDTAAGAAERLLLLGATLDDLSRLAYVNPATSIEYGLRHVEAHPDEFTLMVIDSTGEAMAAGGVDSNSDTEGASWFSLVKRIARASGRPAVVVLDHVPKDKDAPSLYAIGSQRKRAAVTGASYRVDTITAFSKGKSGKLKLIVAKDRYGARPQGATAAVVDVDAEDGLTFTLHLSDAQEAAAKGERFRPTVLMERISRWLEINPRQPKSVALGSVTGKKEHLRTALDVLIEEGWVEVVPGERNTILCVVRSSFRDGMPSPVPVDNFRLPPGRDLPPATSPATSRELPPATSPPFKGEVAGGGSWGPSTYLPVDNFESDPMEEF